jgi:glutathione peroxidase
MSNLHSFNLTDVAGVPMPLSRYAGNIVLLVNVASECGLTPQYAGLERLYQEGRASGLVVIGLPCNQFGAQEPGSEAQILSFCQRNYGVSFPLSAKIQVNGPSRHPLYAWLAGPDAKFPGDIQWNFEKFLCDLSGNVVARFAPDVSPEDAGLRSAVAELLS